VRASPCVSTDRSIPRSSYWVHLRGALSALRFEVVPAHDLPLGGVDLVRVRVRVRVKVRVRVRVRVRVTRSPSWRRPPG